jgi:hypothetical protein
VGQESPGVWPFALTVHAFGNAIVVGPVFHYRDAVVRAVPDNPDHLAQPSVPVIWFGFAIQVYSGTTLWVSKPARYLADGMFEWKLIFVITGMIVTDLLPEAAETGRRQVAVLTTTCHRVRYVLPPLQQSCGREF